MEKLTCHQVRKIARQHRLEHPHIPTVALRAGVSLEVLGYFLGSAWVGKHFVDGRTSFFESREDSHELNYAGIRRIWELADMLLNFQHIEGFGEPLRKLRDDDVETGFAAFEAAKLLYRSGTPLKFVEPTGSLGSNFDLLAFPKSGGSVAVEAKCKLSTTAMKPRKIMRALNRARGQLPEQQPGIIMFRVPVHWADRTDLQGPLARAAHNVLRNSDVLAGILIFSNRFIEASGADGEPLGKASMIVAREFWSERSEFAGAAKWGLCRSSIFDDAGWFSVAKLLDEPWLRSPPLQRGT